ncbi:hypothetical protein GT625_19915 [Burkholderia thailandensis]|nr:hypothetical protein [Burkholderia thailandensis]NBD06133.1 hypothetical protein [Burkholderia thailandensis]NBJ20962.1 hypothetical protein [Burkholderia thailandensis]NOK50592.1 hypothetical protein [Burkholderia thailandensis]
MIFLRNAAIVVISFGVSAALTLLLFATCVVSRSSVLPPGAGIHIGLLLLSCSMY